MTAKRARADGAAGECARTLHAARPYDLLALIYDALYGRWRGRVERRIREKFAAQLGPARTIVDFGCGTGRFAAALERSGKQVVAVDRHPEMLEVARERAGRSRGRMTVVRGDLRRVRVPQLCDLATCFFDTLNHLARRDALDGAIANIAASIRPGGWFLFDVNTPRGVARRWPDPPMWKSGRAGKVAWTFVATGLDGSVRERRGAVEIDWTIRADDGASRRAREIYREVAWTDAEIRRALRRAGFDRIASCDGEELERGVERGLRRYYRARRASSRARATR